MYASGHVAFLKFLNSCTEFSRSNNEEKKSEISSCSASSNLIIMSFFRRTLCMVNIMTIEFSINDLLFSGKVNTCFEIFDKSANNSGLMLSSAHHILHIVSRLIFDELGSEILLLGTFHAEPSSKSFCKRNWFFVEFSRPCLMLSDRSQIHLPSIYLRAWIWWSLISLRGYFNIA